jgi:hypothetical protein
MKVHISQINVGDIIFHEGEEKTVCANNIKDCPFMGRSLFGDSYNIGYKLVTKIR